MNTLPSDESTEPIGNLSVAILAGGRSRRMGVDKAGIRLVENGPTLLELVAKRTQHLTKDQFVVNRNRVPYPTIDLPVVADSMGDTGVLGAIGTAIAHARHENVLVVSCDMPFVNPDLVRMMISLTSDTDAIVPVTNTPSRQSHSQTYQTLHAIYRQSCVTPISDALERGDRQVISFFSDISVFAVTEGLIRILDPELLSFFSINTPEALATARQFASR